MDVLAEYLSAGVIREGEGCLVFGSTMCLCVFTSVPRTHALLYSGCSLVPGLSRIAGGMATAGALTHWFRDNFAPGEVQMEHQSGVSAYSQLGEQAATIPPGSDGIVVLPYFSGERTPIFDTRARGMILGLTVSHTRHHVYRGLLEGVAYGVRHHLEHMAESGVVPSRLTAVGGGSQSDLWMQIVSDVTGRPLDRVEPQDWPGAGRCISRRFTASDCSVTSRHSPSSGYAPADASARTPGPPPSTIRTIVCIGGFTSATLRRCTSWRV